MSGVLSFAADIMVAVLLVATIVTSVQLSRRIARLKADESSMRKTIADLVAATDSAERAVTGLRTTLLECDRALAERIGAAERQEEGLAKTIKAGEAVMGGIGHIVDSTRRAVQTPGRPSPEPTAVEAGGALRHALAAAQAVADRASRRVGNRAA